MNGASGSSNDPARDRLTSTPSSASDAGVSKADSHGSMAPVRCSACQPATAPGTVIGTGPRIGMADAPLSASGSAARGERPLELIASVSPSVR